MSAKHTPGPWTEHEDDCYVYGSPRGVVCDMSLSEFDEATTDANARLIAAAPDLLKACVAFLSKWELVLPHINSAFLMQHIHGQKYDGPTIDLEFKQIEAAIAKAEGK